jgi:HemY protein
MIRMLWRIAVVIALAASFTWLADRPGKLSISWMGRDVEMSVLVATVLLLITFFLLYWAWSLFRRIWRTPTTAREFWKFRRTQKGYASLSRGIIAANAGDAQGAAKHAAIASKTLGDEPLLDVLNAQAAQLQGDRAAVKRAFEAMLKNSETEILGLRGLFAEAKQAGDLTAATAHAERALHLNPRLSWASSAMLQIQSTRKDWSAAAATIATQGKSGLLPRPEADRKRAILLTAEALGVEDQNRDRALKLASEAHDLDPALVPAALVAARCHIANGSTRKAVKVISTTWAKAPHPDLAQLLAQAKPDGPEERFERVRDLVGNTEESLEGAHALARAAVGARRFDAARQTLQPHLVDQPQARLCALMAEIEDASGDKGRAREWLARALTAPRDPLWVADGVASPRWTPVSPVTGEVTTCEWKPPYDMPQLEAPSFIPSASVEAPAQPASRALPPVLSDKPDSPRLLEPIRPDDPGVQYDDK